MTLFCIDTSAEPGVIGVVRANSLIAEREIAVRDRFAEEVSTLFSEHRLSVREIEAIAIGIGPGSFTGLRVGLSFAKGVALALTVPILPVNSLKIIAANAVKLDKHSAVAVISPARRDHVHFQSFNLPALNSQSGAKVVHFDHLKDLLPPAALLLGPGVAKLPGTVRHGLSLYLPQDVSLHLPRAICIAELATQEWKGKSPPEIDRLSPEYGLEFTPGGQK